MNREIKFRFWNNAGKKSKMFYNTEQVIECLKQQNLFRDKTHTYHKLGYDHIGEGCAFMQFTGLKDANGKEIYEGDIIVDIWGNKLAVEWNDDTCKFQLSDGTDLNDRERYSTYKCVVGNIYENPELLNKLNNNE